MLWLCACRWLVLTWEQPTRRWRLWRVVSRPSLPTREGARTTPSVVAFTKAGDRLVGQVSALVACALGAMRLH